MSGVKGQGTGHRDELYARARLEVAVLEYLDSGDPTESHRPIEARTLAVLFNMDVAAMGRLLDEFRLAEVVLYDPATGTAALAPLPT
jgi:hypothetical protein